MITLAHTEQQTIAQPAAIYDLYADVDNWAARFDDGIAWAKLSTPFQAGGRYRIKPKGGPTTKATIVIAEPGKRFLDVSHLLGAKLQFDHVITQTANGVTLSVTATLNGPLQKVWAKILGQNQQSDLKKSTAKLLALAEQK